MTTNNSKFNSALMDATKSLLGQLQKRTRDIIEKRFGLSKKEPMTLEAIGQEYSITRERVRQIEERALRDLRERFKSTPKFAALSTKVSEYLISHGQVRSEKDVLGDFLTLDPGVVAFTFTIHPDCNFAAEDDAFHSRWHSDEKRLKQSEKLIDALIMRLKNEGKVFPSERDFIAFAKSVVASISEVTEPALTSYLGTSKMILKNSFGEYGLISWPEIKPRGLRDKAFIVLKRSGKPLHFREVAKAIEDSKLNSRAVHPQTVHNELIRDERFVLVGRGLYALSDWGFPAGTVRDIIKSVLKIGGPLNRETVVQKVLEKRFVKENTILLNLQNKAHFRRLPDGTYHTKEA